MRVPLSKVWRAFPEMDRFPDDQSALLVHRAVRGSGWGEILATAWYSLPWLVGISVANFGWMQAMIHEQRLRQLLRPIDRYVHVTGLGGQLAVTCAVLMVVLVCLLGVRDAGVKVAVRRHLRKAACPGCGETLLGAMRTRDAVTCEKCSGVHAFKTLGLVSDDLGPPLVVLTATAECGQCRYVIGGLPITRGVVICPECGKRTAVVEAAAGGGGVG